MTDWAPTILGGVLGLETPGQIANASGGGMNLWEALLGVTGTDDAADDGANATARLPARDEVLLAMDYMHGTNSHSCLADNVSAALRWQHWKIVANEKWCNRSAPSARECACDWSEGTYLFNLAHDPYELYNLADYEPSVLAEMKSRLMWHWQNTVANTRWLPLSTDDAVWAFAENNYHVTWWAEQHDHEVHFLSLIHI